MASRLDSSMPFRIVSETMLSPHGVVADNASRLHEPGPSGYHHLRLRLKKDDAYQIVDLVERQLDEAEQRAGERLSAKLPYEAPTLPMLLDTLGVTFVFTTKFRPIITPRDAEITRGTPAQVRFRSITHPKADLPGQARVVLRLTEILVEGETANARSRHSSSFGE